MQVLHFQQAGICRYQVSSVEPDNISRDKFGGRQFLFSSIAHNRCSQGNLFLNVLHGVPGLEFHEEIQDYAEQDNREDDQPADVLSERKRHAAGNDEDDDKRITEETEETKQCSEARLVDESIWAVKTQSPPRLFGRQSCRRCREQFEQFVQWPIPEAFDRGCWFSHPGSSQSLPNDAARACLRNPLPYRS